MSTEPKSQKVKSNLKKIKAAAKRLATFFLLVLFVNQSLLFAQTKLIAYVDPFVGVDRDGNTVPGAAVPFGFANPSPDVVPNPNFRFDTSGYESDKPIIGFSQTHVSGTGGESKYGNFRVTPQTGEIDLRNFASDKTDDSAEAGY
jgi:putative alpha-1,2-mannosidase